jgi:serine/threonine protein kinase
VTGKGDVVGGRYRLTARIGRGAMGVVWQAYDERLARTVAVKLLSFDMEDDESGERVMREARNAAKLQHPNAIAVHDVVEHDGHPCLVMEYLPSQSLSEVVAERGALPADEVARIGAQVAAALAAAHEAGIVHRDVKPDNVLIAPDGTTKLTDFGISKAIGDSTMTASGLIAGTPAFLAPEVAAGEKAGFPSDVFSLGATLYAATEGVPPFGMDENTMALLRKVSEGYVNPPRQSGALGPLLLWLLQADPGARPSMRQAQHHLATGEPPPTVAPRTETRTMPARRVSRRGVWAALAGVVLLGIGIAVGVSLRGPGSPTASPPATPTTSGSTPVTPVSMRCEADYKVASSWPGGYQAVVTVTATETPLRGWTVSWTLPDGQRMRDLWNGTFSVDGQVVTVEPASWNVSVKSTTNFGFNVDTDGRNPAVPKVACTSP